MGRAAHTSKSPVVRLYLASGIQRMAVDTRWDILAGLLSHSEDASDHNLPLMYWYAAEPAYAAGGYARAVEIASEGLAEWFDNPSLRYQLACYEALAGNREVAIEHLS